MTKKLRYAPTQLGVMILICSFGVCALAGWMMLSINADLDRIREQETEILQSCAIPDTNETIRLYYNPGLMDCSWWLTYQNGSEAEQRFFNAFSAPPITKIECYYDKVLVTLYQSQLEPVLLEDIRTELVETPIEYYKAERQN